MYLDVLQKFSHNSRSHVIEKGSQLFSSSYQILSPDRKDQGVFLQHAAEAEPPEHDFKRDNQVPGPRSLQESAFR